MARKFAAAIHAGLTPVLCVGESLEQREAGQTEAILRAQLEPVLALVGSAGFAGAVLAYEPIWAIGTGCTATPEQAQAVHAFLRGEVAKADARIADSLPILYGAVSSPITPASCLHSPMSMAGWSEALHWSPKISWPSHARRPRANPLSFVRGRISKC